MNLLWFANLDLKMIGGTEAMIKLGMSLLSSKGYTSYYLQIKGDKFVDNSDLPVDLKKFLIDKKISTVLYPIGYSKILLEFFFKQGGRNWRNNGGKIISFLHFSLFSPSYYRQRQHELSVYHPIKSIKSLLSITRYYVTSALANKYDGCRYCYSNSDSYILLSSVYIQEFIRKCRISDASKIRILNNPLTKEVNFLSEKKEDIVLFVGRFADYNKRISLLLKSWLILAKTKKIGHWRLILVGSGPDVNKCIKFIKDNKLPNVQYIPACDPTHYFAKSSIFAMTSRYEGWPLTLMEALQFECAPIVTTSIKIAEDILSTEGAVWVNSDNASRFASKLHELMSNNELRNNIVKTLKQRKPMFSANKYRDALANIILQS